MARPCTICQHPDRKAIDRAVLAGEPNRRIASRFDALTEAAIRRHRADHLPTRMVKNAEAREQAESLDLVRELQSCLDYIRKLQRACDAWLLDPDNPNEYSLAPRDTDVQVIYSVPKGDKMIRRKAKLSTLLRRVEQGLPGAEIDRGETKTADPRTLILSASDSMRDQVRLIAELVGKLQTQGTGTINISTLAPVLIASFDAIADPEARAAAKIAVAERLAALDGKALPAAG